MLVSEVKHFSDHVLDHAPPAQFMAGHYARVRAWMLLDSRARASSSARAQPCIAARIMGHEVSTAVNSSFLPSLRPCIAMRRCGHAIVDE